VIPFITVVNLASIDLNLLLTLHVVLEEGSATRAAQRLHLTQSAVSNAIARLRRLLDDPVVVRSGSGLTPTPRASALKGNVAEIVSLAGGIFSPPQRFDPRTATRSFTVACADNQEVADVPAVVAHVLRKMPLCGLRLATVEQLQVGEALGSGDVDLVFGPPGIGGPGLHRLALYEEHGAIIARKKHPALRRLRTGAGIAGARWVDVHVTPGGGVGHRKAAGKFREARFARDIAVTVPHFIAAATIVAATDLLAAVPERFARAVSSMLPLAVLPPPFAVAFPVFVYWHERSHKDEGARFFRRTLQAALAG
jgi:DNA-binding transcriptional LysR family regulator